MIVPIKLLVFCSTVFLHKLDTLGKKSFVKSSFRTALKCLFELIPFTWKICPVSHVCCIFWPAFRCCALHVICKNTILDHDIIGPRLVNVLASTPAFFRDSETNIFIAPPPLIHSNDDIRPIKEHPAFFWFVDLKRPNEKWPLSESTQPFCCLNTLTAQPNTHEQIIYI